MNTRDTLKCWLSISRHFNGKYDYFEYNGNVKITNKMLNKATNQHIYQSIGKAYGVNVPKILSMMYLYNPFYYNSVKLSWIGIIKDGTVQQWWLLHNKYMQSYTRQFTNDINYILNFCVTNNITLSNIFKQTPNGKSSFMFNFINLNKISIETYVILYEIMGLNLHHGDVIISKYSGFMVYDKPKMSNLLKDLLEKHYK